MSSSFFNEIPSGIRVPFMTMEFDSSRAMQGTQAQPYRVLAIGQKLDTGIAEYNIPVRISKKGEAELQFGISSMLAEMVDFYRRVDDVTELWAIAVPDNSQGLKAAASISFSGSVASPGILYLYIAGNRVTLSVAAGDTAADIAAALVDRINNLPEMMVVASQDTDVVKLETKFAGEVGNTVDIRFNYNTGETLPTGITTEITGFAGGAGNPELDDAVAAVAGEWFNGFISPYLDAHNLFLITEELVRRWGPLVMQEGWLFSARRGTFGELVDFGETRNSKHETIMHCHGIMESPWCVAASVAANGMYYGNIDPARPFHTLQLIGIHAPALQDRFSDFPENNQLLYSGISTFSSGVDNTVTIGRLITTYRKNERGADDTAYLDVNTGLTLSYFRWAWRNHMYLKFPRHKLGNDNVRYAPGQAIATPKSVKAECVVLARDLEERGILENVDLFVQELVVERDKADPDRLNFLMRPDLMNQFLVGAAQTQFYL